MNTSRDDDGAPSLKLYYSPGACSLAPHCLLNEIGVGFEAVSTSIAEGAHVRPEYLAINPQGRIPTLVCGKEVLTEVPAILAFLAGLAPGLRLWPHDRWEEARLLSYMAWLSSTLHIAFAKIWRPGRFSDAQSVFPEIAQKGRAEVPAHFRVIESRLGGEFVFGDQLTVADYYTLVFYRWGWRIGLEMNEFPNWTAHSQRMASRPAIKKTIDAEGIALFP